MKIGLIISVLMACSWAWADQDYGFICFNDGLGGCAVLVSKDRETGEYFPTAKGACKVLGHKRLVSASGQNGIKGPYVIISEEGKATQYFPKSEDNAIRFVVVTNLVCGD